MGVAAILVMWPYSVVYIFIAIHPLVLKWNLVTHDSIVPEKTSFNFEIWVTFGQGQILTLTYDTHLTSLSYLFEYLNQLLGLWLQ